MKTTTTTNKTETYKNYTNTCTNYILSTTSNFVLGIRQSQIKFLWFWDNGQLKDWSEVE